MLNLVLVGMMTGLDNFAATTGLGLMDWSLKQRRTLLLAFAGFEFFMPLAGSLLGHEIAAAWRSRLDFLAPTALALAGFLSFLGASRAGKTLSDRRTTPALVLFALALSFDNLFAGIGLAGSGGGHGAFAAPVLGGIAAVLSVLGLTLGGVVSPRLPDWLRRVGGPIVLLSLAAWAVVVDPR